ncbi:MULTISPECIES: SIS domain-containing protein [unclassified Microbacterium]|uniref:D-sedoheptulose-7-phosphate isomerase n=1 Tax=unclassified Microbacterium TaxID=2609290 RepID=UPI000EA93221|nr:MULTISPECIES: SIS domain-containing protein [unclassified Microbacterium]MBT2483829.1 SIS domain-containing protein [Microbacterium sp. ISL-108]RKN66812.1 SIS domain-containing protein [Microbacterium sp. CGR2]
MSDWLENQLDAHIRTATDAAQLLPSVRAVGAVLIDAFERGGTLYTLGNGGSAADAQHFTGEVIGHYRRDRRPLPAVTLTTDATVSTCIANDYAFEDIFSRQVEALARPGDVVAAFTTSGRSQNIIDALSAARANGATTLLFGGGDGGPSLALADHVLLAPSDQTPRIQELHTFLLHALSEILDAWAAGEEPT